MEKRILLKNIDCPDLHRLAKYEELGGYAAARAALASEPASLIQAIKRSGLRGRGGAGFSTGTKWEFIPKNSGKPVYLICNADESEPGTFKDRLLMERDPHLCLEGMIISAWAIGAHWACVYIRGEYAYSYERLKLAIDECYQKGYLGKNIFGSDFNFDIILHRGAGAYICGEETALIESLEGKKGQPRLKPPFFPAAIGLYKAPTIVNNVETLCAVTRIFQMGADAYAALGTEKSKGTKLFSVSGHVNKPGVYEVEMGYPLLDLINVECGGVWKDRALKGVIPGGSSMPILTAEELKGVVLDYESIQAAGSYLGSGGFIVFDETANMLDVACNIAHFYAHESCGQCTPCREGAHWIEKIFNRIASGGGIRSDLSLIESIAKQVEGHTICVFGEAFVWPAKAFVKKFPDDFANLLSDQDRLIQIERRKEIGERQINKGVELS
ncbi:MAG TPA: NADH-quinone oxidoreductase subunit NuoF [Oligoflexia bacterium]|nr:NADH-quinone oxidoreductase subunit NuoF [Oligoflexia bacterium]HMP27583.1 NADH-quinone oxidoreductase subunit NuoF [Oligoflexia bacterium]